jgi:NADP-dependent 3-hydroxy acid dehydrogenase YdfG
VSETLKGKRILVTGASSGLGAHFAEVLLAKGADVVVAARRMEALESLAERLKPIGALRCLPLDVTDAHSRKELLEQAGELDVLVNNAGLARENSAFSHTEED